MSHDISLRAKWGNLQRTLRLLLGTRWDVAGDLGTDIAALLGGTGLGVLQIVPTTIDLNQAAGNYTLYTGTTQDCALQGFIIRMSGGAIGGAVTAISVQTNDATPQVIISQNRGVVGNLANEAQLAWDGEILIVTGALIQITIYGGAAGAARVCDVTAIYRSVVAGGHLAP